MSTQLVVKHSEGMDTGEVVARIKRGCSDPLETLRAIAHEHLPNPVYLTRDGQYWASVKTGELVGFGGGE